MTMPDLEPQVPSSMRNPDSDAAIPEWLTRTAILCGDAGVRTLQKAHVLLVGAGGVGGGAAEMLVRAGVGHLTLVDGDAVAASNRNRQLIALAGNVGERKVVAAAARLLQINPELDLKLEDRFLTEADAATLLESAHFDFLIDAIDSVGPKCALLAAAYHQKLACVSSMGAGGKFDPLAVRVEDLSKTIVCKLARSVRLELKNHYRITQGIRCVFSTESALASAVIAPNREAGELRPTVGTISYMPNLFGIVCASVCLRTLLQQNRGQ